MFEQVLGYANHLGLYGEQTGSKRRSAGKLPTGVYAPGPDQRCL